MYISPKSDPHLYESETPLIDGHTYFAKCGKAIVKARAIMMWDSLKMGAPVSYLQIRGCRKCWQNFSYDSLPEEHQRYLYGIIAGKEQETEE